MLLILLVSKLLILLILIYYPPQTQNQLLITKFIDLGINLFKIYQITPENIKYFLFTFILYFCL